MSIQTNIQFLSPNEPAWAKANKGTEEQQKAYADDYGYVMAEYGGPLDYDDSVVQETDDEYGGWVIAVKDIPKDATHIYISRW